MHDPTCLLIEDIILPIKIVNFNFQIIFKKNEPVKYASRNKLLVEGEKLFGYKTFLPNIKGVGQLEDISLSLETTKLN